MDEPIRILLVEDMPVDAELARREILKTLKACVFHQVDTREDFVEELATFHPDLIVSDYRMPRFDGLSALRLALEHAPLTPLIMLTGSMNEDTAVECMKAGATNYVIKEHIKRLGQSVVHALDEKQVRLERRRAEEALRESEVRFRSVYENATVGIYRTTPDGRLLMANPAAVRMLGYDSIDELANCAMGGEGALLPLSCDKYGRQLESQGAVMGLERALTRRDGSTMVVRESVRAIRDGAGGVQFYDGTFEDISERKQAEERSRQEAARTQTLVRTAARLNATLELDAALAAVCEETARALGIPVVAVYFFDEAAQELFPVMAVGLSADERKRLPRIGLEAVRAQTGADGKVFTISNPGAADAVDATNAVQIDIRSMTGGIMRYGDKLIGTLGVVSIGREREPSPDEQALLEGIADQAALAISNARLYTEQRLAEKALRESEERYRTLVQTLPDALTVLDTQGNISYVAESTVRFYGLETVDQAVGQYVLDWVDPSCHAAALADIPKVLAGGHLENQEYLLRKRDGTRFYGEVSASCLVDSQGRPAGIITIVRDVSDRKAAEEALRESEERYRTLAEAAPDVIFILGLDGAFQYVNEVGARYAGSTPQDVIGRKRSLYFPPDKVAEQERILQDVLGQGLAAHDESRIPTVNGEVWMSTELVPLRGKNGEVRAALGISRDITEQKRAEAALRESETRYRTRTEELEVLFTLSTRLREAQTGKEMLQVALREMRRVVDMDSAAVLLLDGEGEHFSVALAEGDVPHAVGHNFEAARGVIGRVLHTRQPYVTGDYNVDPHRISKGSPVQAMGATVCVPLQSEEDLLGILMAVRRGEPDRQPFSDQAVRLLGAMGEMVGNTLRRTRLFDDVQRHLRRTQALHEIQLTVASSFDLKLTLNSVLEHAAAQLEVDAVDVLLFSEHTLTLEYAAGRGFRTHGVERTRLRLGEGASGRAAMERRLVNIPNLNQAGSEFLRTSLLAAEGFNTYYGVPLIAKRQVKGVLEIFHRTPLHPDNEWLAFLDTLAGQVAIAIDNLALFGDLQHSNFQLALAYDATIEGWTRALDLRDKETEGHTQRVIDLTMRLARAMGIDDSDLVHIRRGAFLHDMGKMGIPDAILLKPAALTEEEWTIMRRHPQYAFDMISPIDYLRSAVDIPYCHHEKWDGTGYPRGLKGEEIPLAARVFAIVDVWDAITSERPYRKAWSRERALEHISSQAGEHFDPRVVEMFLSVLHQG